MLRSVNGRVAASLATATTSLIGRSSTTANPTTTSAPKASPTTATPAPNVPITEAPKASSPAAAPKASPTTATPAPNVPITEAPKASSPAAAATSIPKPTSPAAVAPKDIAKNTFAAFLNTRCWDTIDCGEHCKVYVDSNTFAWIVMDRAGSSANALGESFLASLKKGFEVTDRLIKAQKARICIVASAKDTFCVGADVDMLYPVTDRNIAAEASKVCQDVFNGIEETKDYPIICAINGLALGGGCELALACHHRLIASDNASMGLPECMLGLLPGAGGCYRLPRQCGLQTALKWILTSAPQKAAQCKKVGVVDAVIPSADRFPGECRFHEGVRAWAGKLVDKPVRPHKGKKLGIIDNLLQSTSYGRKLAYGQAVKTLNKKTKGKYLGQYKALEVVLHSSANIKNRTLCLNKEAQCFADLLVTPEAKNQISLYFLDNGMKKVEKKTGMTKEEIPVVKKIGVIGAGVMGSGVVHYFANKGYPVAVKDITQEAVDKGLAMVEGEFQQQVKRKRMDKNDLTKKMALVTGGTTDDIFKDCDVIIEAAVEIMSVKKKLLQALEEGGVLDGKKLFATNTSSLSLTELQEVSKYPKSVVGMHFFNPVKKMPLVEVIKGKHTSKEAAATIFQLAVKTGKKPIIVGDGPGFLVNRVLGVYMAEAGRLCVGDGACPALVDSTILNFGMPMGPFRLLDEVGLDVATHVGPVLETGLKSKRFAVDSRINQMVKDGLLGKKNGKGFYKYDGDKEVGINSAVVSKYLSTDKRPNTAFPVADIVDRCVLLMVNEACMILQEGIAATPEDIDIGMVWGTGFPPFRGGLMQYADHRGAKEIVARMQELQKKTNDDRFKPADVLVRHAKDGTKFFPDRPFVPYQERTGMPKVNVA